MLIDLQATERQMGMVGKMLARRGLPTDIGEAIRMLAATIRDHKHLESLLTSCGGDERQNLYDSVRPHLKFTAKPLDVYISSVGQRAEREQWPTYDNGKLKEFSSARDAATVQQQIAGAIAEKTLTVTCSACTKQATFHRIGMETPVDVILKARKAGWVYSPVTKTEKCPECSPDV